MSGHAAFASDDKTSLHDAEPDAEPHSESDYRLMSQQRPLIELPNGREPRRGISKTDCTDYIKEDPLVRFRPSSDVCIFRVPNMLKDAKKKAYVPRRVSLGPHHHGSAELRQMGHHKERALTRMMQRFNRKLAIDPNNMDFAERAREEILKMEKEIRDSYEENIDCDGETLAGMLILDGCFILEVLRALVSDEAVQSYEPIFWVMKLQYAAYDILYDILMLENQVPLIVLLKLLELEINSAVDVEERLLDVLGKSILRFYPFEDETFDIKQSNFHDLLGFLKQSKFYHILDFLHTFVVSPPINQDGRVDQGECNISIKCCRMCTGMIQHKNISRGEHVDQGECGISMDCCSRHCTILLQDKNKAGDNIISIPHAVELKNAGIKFKRCKGGIQGIKFDPDSATILLPRICITDETEIVFRNLIALEMCKPSEINYASCYVGLMDKLIDSQEDVALLGRMGVLSNCLGSDKEVADLFNGLCKDVTLNMEDVFDKLTKNVNDHYNDKVKIRIAELVREHFSSPWKALALAAAIVILLLTVVQTIFSIIKG